MIAMSYDEWVKREIERDVTAALDALEESVPDSTNPPTKSRSYQERTQIDIKREQYVQYEGMKEPSVYWRQDSPSATCAGLPSPWSLSSSSSTTLWYIKRSQR